MANNNGIPRPEVQLSNVPAPIPAELMETVNKQKAVVNQSRVIKAQINELSEKLGDLNSTVLDNLADELDSISDQFEIFRTRLIVRLGVQDGE